MNAWAALCAACLAAAGCGTPACDRDRYASGCPAGQACDDSAYTPGYCRKVCQRTADCGGGEVCSYESSIAARWCVSLESVQNTGCAQGCAADLHCGYGACTDRTECRDASACAGGDVCAPMPGICEPACTATSGCASDAVCTLYSATLAACGDRAGSGCDACGGGDLCLPSAPPGAGVCGPRCQRTMDCAAGSCVARGGVGVCAAGRCAVTCQPNEFCDPGTRSCFPSGA